MNSQFAAMPGFIQSADSVATAIEASALVKTYGKARALDGLSFSVRAGTIFALLGPNGAGKTTTIKILNTLTRPDSGTAQVAGIDVLREPERVRQAIGCVSQKHGFDAEDTGRENLTLQGRIYGLKGNELKVRVAGLLDRFGLTEAADRVVRTYSGGMQRKLDVAMGLVHRPRVLFLDEPTTGLDPHARTELWQEVTRLTNEEAISVLLTTHYLEEADRLAERVAIVDRGRIVAEGPPEKLKGELFGDAIHIELAQSDLGQARETLERLERVRDVIVEKQNVHARVDHGASVVPTMLAALESAGIKVVAVTVSRPSLDDVYLRHTGRRFVEADQGATQ
jgi:ABC-2 type transport system ATP-binding protein